MRAFISTAAVAAMAASLALTAVPAFAGTNFDLGVDVSGVAHTTRAVDSYLAAQAPETQAALRGACENYVQNPTSAQDIATLAFCRIAVGGGNTASFASTNPPVVFSAPAINNAPAYSTPTRPGNSGGYSLCFNGSPNYPTC